MWLPISYNAVINIYMFVTILKYTQFSNYYYTRKFMFYVIYFSTVRIERLEFDPDNQVIRGERSDDESD